MRVYDRLRLHYQENNVSREKNTGPWCMGQHESRYIYAYYAPVDKIVGPPFPKKKKNVKLAWSPAQ